MIHSNGIVGITVSRCSFIVSSQYCVKVSASLTDVGNLAVRAFDLANCSQSVVGRHWSVSVVTAEGLWATRML